MKTAKQYYQERTSLIPDHPDDLLEIAMMQEYGDYLKQHYDREYESLKGSFICQKNEINDLRQQLSFAKLENIADIKSLKTMLSIYENDGMTHREKAYLGGKLGEAIDNIINRKITKLDNNNDLPF